MKMPIHATARVQPGHKIEVTDPELDEGESVEVYVLPSGVVPTNGRSALEIIESLGQHRLFSSPNEVDRYVRGERDAWDR
jgi:hypothetical protein